LTGGSPARQLPRMKTKFIVYQESALCYAPENGSKGNILSVNMKGLTHLKDGDIVFFSDSDSRPATRKDFDDFRVFSNGYEANKENYIFPTK